MEPIKKIKKPTFSAPGDDGAKARAHNRAERAKPAGSIVSFFPDPDVEASERFARLREDAGIAYLRIVGDRFPGLGADEVGKRAAGHGDDFALTMLRFRERDRAELDAVIREEERAADLADARERVDGDPGPGPDLRKVSIVGVPKPEAVNRAAPHSGVGIFPEDVFDDAELREWAARNGYVKGASS